MAQFVITFVAALVVGGYGLVALFSPHRVQRWWLTQRLRRRVALRVYGLLVESPRYILYLRVTGALSLIGALALFYSVLRLAVPWIR